MTRLATEGAPVARPPAVVIPEPGAEITVKCVRNAPELLSSFVGRRAELARLDVLLARARMVTITGPAGVGKTRLAFQAAACWGSPEAHVVDPAGHDLRSIIARAQRAPGATLLVMDGCDERLDAAAAATARLLRQAPRVRIIATCRRAPLGVPGETVYGLGGMALPSDGGLPALRDSDAALLFAERARQLDELFQVDASNATDVASICRRVGGNPGAIELAADRTRALTPKQIAESIAAAPVVLKRGARPLVDAAADRWGHDALNDDERIVLERLATFPTGLSTAACCAICGDASASRADVRNAVNQLIERSLILTERDEHRVRLALPAQLQPVVTQHAAASGQRQAACARHAAYFCALARRADELRLTPAGRAELRAEEANLCAAVAHAIGKSSDDALLAVAGLSRWWLETGRAERGARMCARALAAVGEGSPDARVTALSAAGMLALFARERDVARSMFDAALATGDGAEPGPARAQAQALASIRLAREGAPAALPSAQAAVAVLRQHGDSVELAWGLAAMARTCARLGLPAEADGAACEAAALAAEAGDRAAAAFAHSTLALVAGRGQRLHEVRDLLREDHAQMHAEAPQSVLAAGSIALGLAIEAHLGNAGPSYRGALAARRRLPSDARLTAVVLEQSLAVLALGLGRTDEAARWARGTISCGQPELETQGLELLATVSFARGDRRAMRTIADRLGDADTGAPRSRGTASAESARGRAAVLDGQMHEARARLCDAVSRQLELGLRIDAQESMEALAVALTATSDWVFAGHALACAEGDRERMGSVRLPAEPAWLEPLRRTIVGALGARAAADLLAQGRPRGLEEVLEQIRRDQAPLPECTEEAELTPTEAEIANLVCRGMTNAEIASSIYVSRGTVKLSLSRIFDKLGVANRTALAAVWQPGREG